MNEVLKYLKAAEERLVLLRVQLPLLAEEKQVQVVLAQVRKAIDSYNKHVTLSKFK